MTSSEALRTVATMSRTIGITGSASATGATTRVLKAADNQAIGIDQPEAEVRVQFLLDPPARFLSGAGSSARGGIDAWLRTDDRQAPL